MTFVSKGGLVMTVMSVSKDGLDLTVVLVMLTLDLLGNATVA